MRYAVCYVSTANPSIKRWEIEELLLHSRKENNATGITGLLLYSDGNFLQVMEGEKEQIQKLYRKIKEDKRHHNLIRIFGREINKESFDGYDVDFVSEETKYKEEILQGYLDHIKVLDESCQRVVKGILKTFIYSNN
ncbi:BLUF domain-containing protein [Zunongwangia sp. F363]|uniref:BLUF domain-containing protein n=1 Tax=Autumnicola tepida TaxID=3075595 RepID=A0ABU3C5M7_9FLAO|nr:BLUF domain-containing protein [Zunongwangia sp. F363]MDT0641651.1 BLUF domain-containing protein [Zunongwangia sp. F363]